MNITEFIYECNLKKVSKILYPSLLNNESKKLIIYEKKDIILEHYLNAEYLETFYNTVVQGTYLQEYTNLQIANLLPIKLKLRRKLLDLDIPNTLIIFNIFFSGEYIKVACEKAKEYCLDLDVLQLKRDVTLAGLNHSVFFFSYKNLPNYSFMFLNAVQVTLEDFRHEFMHYYQWCTGDDLIDINEEIQVPTNISLLTNKQVSNQFLEHVFNKVEILPYINELIDQLKEYGIMRKEFYEYFKKRNKFKWNNESDIQYVKRISQTEFFKYLKNRNLNLLPILVFVLEEIYQINSREIGTTILSQLN